MHHVLWCEGILYINAHRVCHQDHPRPAEAGQRAQAKNIRDSKQHNLSVWILFKEHIFFVPEQVLFTTGRSCHGVTYKPHSSNQYMENFEVNGLSISSHPLGLWKRYADDTFVVIKTAHKSGSWTTSNPYTSAYDSLWRPPGQMVILPFLDTGHPLKPNGSLETTVYRKPTHTDQYLQWNNHHTISAKLHVVSTLHHGARAVCSNPQLLQREEEYLQEVLSRCKYPVWVLNRMKIKSRTQTIPVNNNTGTNTSTSTTSNNQRPHMVVPYTKGLSKSLKNVCSKKWDTGILLGVLNHLKPSYRSQRHRPHHHP